MIEITTSNGYTAIIDDVDADLAEYRWCRTSKGEIQCNSRSDGMHGKRIHRIIAERMGLTIKGKLVDHEDRDPANNRRSNLRLATYSQNAANSKRHSDNKSGFKGVRRAKGMKTNPWMSQIGVRGETLNLGFFPTEEEAHEAYLKAARHHFGEFACGG